MSDNTTPAETPSTETQPAETTLEDVYKTYNVEEAAKSFNPQPQTQPQQAQPVQQEAPPVALPDPVMDPTGYKAFESHRIRETAVLRQALNAIAGKQMQFEQAAKRQAEEADIKRAVEQVNSHLGDSKLDPDVVEIALGAEARRDPRFLALWEQRSANPKAFNEGIKAFSSKLGKKFSMRADPQIAENFRALKETTSTKATTAPEESLTDKLGKLSGSDFDRAMSRIRGASY